MPPRYQCIGLGPAWTWRLLGSNHRALARGPAQFATAELAGADALAVGALAPTAQIDIVPAPGTTWRWLLTVDGLPRALSAVGYARRLECVRAVARFRDCAPTAPLATTVPIRQPDPRRRRRPAEESLRDSTIRKLPG